MNLCYFSSGEDIWESDEESFSDNYEEGTVVDLEDSKFVRSQSVPYSDNNKLSEIDFPSFFRSPSQPYRPPTVKSVLTPKVRSSKCSPKCKKGCSEQIKGLDQDAFEALKNVKGNTFSKSKNNLLLHLRSQSNFGLETNGYVFKGHTFCTQAFSHLVQISEYILKKILRDFKNDSRQYIHGNSSNSRESTAAMKFIIWMKTFSQLYGQSAPDECTTVLPSWLTKASLFKIYLKESTAPFVKISSFYKLFKDKFGHARADRSLPHVRISQYSTHSQCSQCVALSNYQKSCKSKLEFEMCKRLQFKHREQFGHPRRRIRELQELAERNPEEHLFISTDGMDNRKSDLPKFQQNAKNFGSFHKLPSHITGAIVTSGFYPEKIKNFLFVNHNNFEQVLTMSFLVYFQLLLNVAALSLV